MAPVSTCLLLHGAGSTPEFMQRAFGAAAAEAQFELLTPDVSGMSIPQMLELLDSIPADVIGGVSLGAHAAALYAARFGWSGPVYAVMPAWLGEPGPVAGLTAHTAQRLQTQSLEAVLAEFRAAATTDWIAAELVRAWSTMSPHHLAHVLRVAAVQPAPTVEDLRTIQGPVTVVALADDPTHPEEVAVEWAAATNGALHRVARHAGPLGLAQMLPQVLARVSASR
jgi:pimeloyl-ACP methyl ester carboxylesterase